MLVLTRKAGQSIVLDDNVEITVTQIANGRVRLGISAPHDIDIRRAELIQSPHESPGLPIPAAISK